MLTENGNNNRQRPPVTRAQADAEIEALQNDWRKCGYIPILQRAAKHAQWERAQTNPDDPKVYARTLPWITQRLVQWSIADPGCDAWGLHRLSDAAWKRLWEGVNHFVQSTSSRYALQRLGVPALRAIAFLQFMHQEVQPIGILRQYAMLSSLPADHPVLRAIQTRVQLTPLDIYVASYLVLAGILKENSHGFTLDEVDTLRFPRAKLIRFLNALSRSDESLKADLRRGRYEISLRTALQQSFFRKRPIYRESNRYLVWGNALAIHALREFAYDRLCESEDETVLSSYGKVFENYVDKPLTSICPPKAREGDLLPYLAGGEKSVDFILDIGEALVLVESKATPADEATQVAHDLTFIGDRLKGSILAAVEQGQQIASLVSAGRFESLGIIPRAEVYLLHRVALATLSWIRTTAKRSNRRGADSVH